MRSREQLEAIKKLSTMDAVVELINFCSEHDMSEYTSDFIETDDVTGFIQRRLDDCEEWESVACCLQGIIQNRCDEYYYIDAYQNLDIITKDTIDKIIGNILVNESDLLEEEEK